MEIDNGALDLAIVKMCQADALLSCLAHMFSGEEVPNNQIIGAALSSVSETLETARNLLTSSAA